MTFGSSSSLEGIGAKCFLVRQAFLTVFVSCLIVASQSARVFAARRLALRCCLSGLAITVLRLLELKK